ncbi:MAG: hemerythrin domain-containing protein [Candidatus Micrarchaeota archaeon]|nr:hemerythrin domain-containing protein [Candidatus Micrarchaeota archaeon]MDE1847337.1 hemerythrin domain-containing protein [Candidatus Micrarchaeota archaeon]MDE1863952.1 hemerythrin domain-containing protein [Candidatus Micrarchaeota archaeon]
MEGISEFMKADHGELDDVFESFRVVRETDSKRAKILLAQLREGLGRHILMEEKVLFPLFGERKVGRNYVSVADLNEQHRRIKELLAQIDKDFSLEKETEDSEAELEQILVAHDIMEERTIYPWIERHVDGAAKKKAMERISEMSD